VNTHDINNNAAQNSRYCRSSLVTYARLFRPLQTKQVLLRDKYTPLVITFFGRHIYERSPSAEERRVIDDRMCLVTRQTAIHQVLKHTYPFFEVPYTCEARRSNASTRLGRLLYCIYGIPSAILYLLNRRKEGDSVSHKKAKQSKEATVLLCISVHCTVSQLNSSLPKP